MPKPNKELRQIRYARGEIPRIDHCSFPKLNREGKCIADCHYNISADRECDCIGGTGKTMNFDAAHEVRVGTGFIDGSDRVIAYHTDGSYDIDESTGYKPDVNPDCSWGKTGGK